jgi:hypothetical protein
MTSLRKTIKRECLRTSEQGRPIIVALEPGDVIALKQKGRRRWYRLPLSAVFWAALKAEAREMAKQKAEARKTRRKNRPRHPRKRTKRPPL